MNKTMVIVLTALMLTGCHSRMPIQVPDANTAQPTAAVFTQLKAGDHVRVMTRSGDVTFVVADVQPEALMAKDGRRFPFADITRLEKSRLSVGKTIALSAGLIFVLILGYAIAWTAAMPAI